MALGIRERMAERASREVPSGSIVNLGIGIPTLVADFIPADRGVSFHGENGILGIGPAPVKGEEHPLVSNAGGLPCTVMERGSYFDSALSFAMIRKGLIDIAILGTLEVSSAGDLANWIIPGKLVPGMGGGLELARNAGRVIVVTTHVNKKGESKIKRTCTLPLTAPSCVDTIITDLAVMKVRPDGLHLIEIFPHTTVEEIVEKTDAELIISTPPAVITPPQELKN